jgi:tetratricopeptide (TPR) repeat protein
VILASGGGDSDLGLQVHERLVDLEMLVKLEDAPLRWSQVRDSDFDADEAGNAYAKAFREYGVDVEALDPQTAGTQLRARDIRLELAAALDGWAGVLLRQDTGVWKDRLAAARAADSDPFRDRVREAMARGDRKALEELAGTDPVTDLPAPTVQLMARVLYAVGGVEQSLALLSKAQRQHPEDFWINFNLAGHLSKLNPAPADEVIRYLSVAKALRPQTPIAYTNLGIILAKKGRLDEAIVELREAIRLQDNAVSRKILGDALLDKGPLTEAIAEFRKALEFKKDYAEAYIGLGDAFLKQDRTEDAIAQYRKAISLKDTAPPHIGLGSVFYHMGLLKEAIAEYRNAIRLNKESAQAHTGLGSALERTGGLDEAIKEHQKAIELKKEYAEAHLNLGTALHRKRLFKEALAEYETAAKLAPNFAEFHSNLGSVLRQLGQLDKAIDEHREAIRLKKNDPWMHVNLGNALVAGGRVGEAISVLNEAVRLFPESVAVHNALAWILATCSDARFRNPARAVELAEKAVALQRDDPGCWNTLGVGRYRLENWKGCIEALQESVALSRGGDANDWFFLAMARWQLGDKKDARKWYDRAVQWMEKNESDDPDLKRFQAEATELLGVRNDK